MPKLRDLTGQTHNFLRVKTRLPNNSHNQTVYLCECLKCGTEKAIIGQHIFTGHAKSCGCLWREIVPAAHLKHGNSGGKQKRSGAYQSWAGMIIRCENPNNPKFPSYGGRGITVCARWRSDFRNFLADMGDRPAGLTIDRIDNDKGYEPGNCRWATRAQQQRNRRMARLITVNGVTKNLSEWALAAGVADNVILGRIKAGWPIEVAATAGAVPRGHRRPAGVNSGSSIPNK